MVEQAFVREVIVVRGAGVNESEGHGPGSVLGPVGFHLGEDAGLAAIETSCLDVVLRAEPSCPVLSEELTPQCRPRSGLGLDRCRNRHDSTIAQPLVSDAVATPACTVALGGKTRPVHPLCLSGCLGRGNTKKSFLRNRILGLWRSLVAHLTGGQGVAGSNPVSPTKPGSFQFYPLLSRGKSVKVQSWV